MFHMVDSRYVCEVMKAREAGVVSSTHGSCRMVLMALYDGSEVLWLAMGEGKGGNPDRTGVFGKHEPPLIIVLSGCTSRLGPYRLGALRSGDHFYHLQDSGCHGSQAFGCPLFQDRLWSSMRSGNE